MWRDYEAASFRRGPLFGCLGFKSSESQFRAGLSPYLCDDVVRHVVTVVCRTCGEREFRLCEYDLEIMLDCVRSDPDELDGRFVAYCGNAPHLRYQIVAVSRVHFVAVVITRRREVSFHKLLADLVQLADPQWKEGEGDPPF